MGTFFHYRRRRQAFVVMRGIDRSFVTKTKDTRMHGIIQLLGRALLGVVSVNGLYQCMGCMSVWIVLVCIWVENQISVDPTSGQNRYAGKTGMSLLLWKGFVKNSQFWGLFGMLLLLVYF